MSTKHFGWAQAAAVGVLAVLSAAGAVWTARGEKQSLDAVGKAVPAGTASADSECPPPLLPNVAGLDAAHKVMIENRLARANPSGAKMSACFAPGTPNEVMEAFRATEAKLNNFGDRFQFAARWGATAMVPSPPPLGKPTTITWSVVPDGTPLDGFNGEPAASSNLRARLDSLYGNQATWLPILQSIFDRWSQVSGLKYVYEPSDDGAAMTSPSVAFGVVGVRGDVRISGHTIDGNSGVLAYNFYPDGTDAIGGDMVIDTGDNFFFDLSNNSVRLRNVMMHEHGHGIGQAHVCPIESTKLMEPFVSTIFDGMRHDDIRHAQYSYGDVNEPNDTAAQATNLGSLDCAESLSLGQLPTPAGSTAGAISEVPFASTLSISDVNDDDFYKFTVSGAASISVTATPLGYQYDDSAQACSGASGSCCSGNPINSLSRIDLAINVLKADGTTLVTSSDASGIGASETLSNALLPGAGTYYIQIKPSSAVSNAQFYSLSIRSQPRTLIASIDEAAKAAVPAGELVPIKLQIAGGTEAFSLAQSKFFFRISGGPFFQAPIYDHGGGQYVAALPNIPCSAAIAYYAELRSTSGTLVRLPCSGVYAARSGESASVYSTDFSSNAGWVVGPNTATAGLWTWGIPVATAAQPGGDHTGPGGSCFFTGQGVVGGGIGAADVDSGSTLLTSPAINLAASQDADISYWRWYSNGAGSNPYTDTFVVQVSNDGGATWATAETVGPGSISDVNVNPGWRFKTIRFSTSGLAPTANVKVRFNAQDTDPASLVEAAIDDFSVRGLGCSPQVWCTGDLNLDALVDDFDFTVFASAYDKFDCADPTMPVACPSDLNNDGQVDDADFVLFVGGYDALLCP
ncbi:MAG: matrixin family metalloprotease [Phycisphaerales bacterium]|nr:matrixin family metalloprotease [Planctomycetota bacterium]